MPTTILKRRAYPTQVADSSTIHLRPSRQSLRSNIVWTAFGNATYAACQWLILIAIGRVSLSYVGEFALGIAIAQPVFLLANLNLRYVQATDASKEHAFSMYLGLRLLSTSLALAVIGLIAYFAGYPLATVTIILAVAACKAIESVSDVIFGELQSREYLGSIARSMILKGLLSVVTIAAVLVATGSLLAALVAMCIAWFSVLLFYDVPQVLFTAPANGGFRGDSESLAAKLRSIVPTFQAQPLAEIFLIALPLGVVMMLNSLGAYIPRYFIEHTEGNSALGLYASIYGCLSGVYFFQITLGHALLPRLARHYANREKNNFVRIAAIVFVIGALNGLLAIVIAWVGGGKLLGIVFSPEYADGGALFFWLAVASAIQCLNGALAYFLHAARKFRSTALATFASTLVVLAGSVVLVPEHGAIGGAWAFSAGLAVSGLVLAAQFYLLLRDFEDKTNAA